MIHAAWKCTPPSEQETAEKLATHFGNDWAEILHTVKERSSDPLIAAQVQQCGSGYYPAEVQEVSIGFATTPAMAKLVSFAMQEHKAACKYWPNRVVGRCDVCS